jgi:hypothetical protein
LRVEFIESLFEEIKWKETGYVLSGEKFIKQFIFDGLFFGRKESQSCSGLSFELLCAGGILDHCYFYQDLNIKWFITSPDKLLNLVKRAKDYEWKTYENTQELTKIEGEYIPDIPKDTSYLSCVIS